LIRLELLFIVGL
jgi:hypothetical protein